jgi:hypothetical protein
MPFDGVEPGRRRGDAPRKQTGGGGNGLVIFVVGSSLIIIGAAEALVGVCAVLQWLVTGHWHWPQKFN